MTGTKCIAILQSNYIPWKGYFDMMNRVDEFVLYDQVQYTKNDWRNRNKIKSPQGPVWLTIPVSTKGSFGQSILETQVTSRRWREKHWKSICQNYARAAYFAEYKPVFEPLYLADDETYLSNINRRFIDAVRAILGIETRLTQSTDYELIDGPTERLVHLCQQAGATEYLTGLAAKDYLDESLFTNAGIKLTWMDYSGYPEYDQLFPPFEHAVSVLDLIFNEGPNAPRYMKSFR